jgi:hypothetical protein
MFVYVKIMVFGNLTQCNPVDLYLFWGNLGVEAIPEDGGSKLNRNVGTSPT